jgi:hypothetical protein
MTRPGTCSPVPTAPALHFDTPPQGNAFRLVAVGDVNGDGGDIAVGAFGHVHEGRAYALRR